MTSKTAMQQLIEWLESFEDFPTKPTAQNVREKAWQLLATEKQDIADAWTAGREYGCKHDDPESGEQYYTQTFNSQNTQQ